EAVVGKGRVGGAGRGVPVALEEHAARGGAGGERQAGEGGERREEQSAAEATDARAVLGKHRGPPLCGRPRCSRGASISLPSVARPSSASLDPWLCVPASRRVCPCREGVFPQGGDRAQAVPIPEPRQARGVRIGIGNRGDSAAGRVRPAVRTQTCSVTIDGEHVHSDIAVSRIDGLATHVAPSGPCSIAYPSGRRSFLLYAPGPRSME